MTKNTRCCHIVEMRVFRIVINKMDVLVFFRLEAAISTRVLIALKYLLARFRTYSF